MPDSRATFSLCMIVRDEAANLPLSLGPVRECFDDMVVVDTGSTDGTPELARSYGARVIRIEWPDDFAAARNVSLSMASGDWIMWLDADNSLSTAAVEDLRKYFDQPRRSILWCTEVVVPQGERLLQKRVFPNRPNVRFAGKVHEQLIHPADYDTVMTPVEITHWGYADRAAARTKGERNLSLLREMADLTPDDPYLHYQLGRTLYNLREFSEALHWLNRAAKGREAARGNGQGLFLHAHILKAQTLERLGRPVEADQVLRGLVENFPGYGPGLYHLGRSLYNRGDPAGAVRHLEGFLQVGMNDLLSGQNAEQMRFTAAMLLGRCLEKDNRGDEARQAYQTAMDTGPDNPEPVLALAELDWKEGRGAEARQRLACCLSLFPENRRALNLWREVNAGA